VIPRVLLTLLTIAALLEPARVGAAPGDAAEPAPERVRIKDLTHVEGVRENQLLGYGLVVGLQNTGDDLRSRFTIQSVVSMLNRLGVRMDLSQVLTSLYLRNVAAVVVTAKLPPFARRGARIDVTVASLSSAYSLAGGVLLQTPLLAGDGQVYVMAQGPLAVGGYSVLGEGGSSVSRNHLNTGRIAGGGLVEREVPFAFQGKDKYLLALRRPDFTTAFRIAQEVNRAFGGNLAVPLDPGTIELTVPPALREKPVEFFARLEVLEVRPDRKARVVIAERTGTVVMGEEVRIATVAVTHGNLNIQITTTLHVSQPAPFSRGRTVVAPQSDVQVSEGKPPLRVVPHAVRIGDLVRALNALGATPRDLISILQAIRAAGALEAELEVL
jgi:flagellar P-ring protein precursor FlgI